MIEFRNVSKEFIQGDKKISVLNNLNFKLEDEGNIAVIGKSGSGKSTFLSLLAGLDSPTEGEVLLDGEEIFSLSEKELTHFRARHIGIVFQSFHLIPNFTAFENIMLPLEVLKIKDAKKKTLDILELVGLADRAHHFPTQLSGGEKQRVAIARAMVTNPKIILADEPSGNLDPETGELVMGTLLSTAKKLSQTLILVTHDIDLAKKCDNIFEIKNHKIEKL